VKVFGDPRVLLSAIAGRGIGDFVEQLRQLFVVTEDAFDQDSIGMIAVHDYTVAAILLQAKRRCEVDAKLCKPLAQATGELDEILLRRNRLGCLCRVSLTDFVLLVQDIEKRHALGDAVDYLVQYRHDSSASERQ
jgi:hypothetical protein